jgi:hypothetical protein
MISLSYAVGSAGKNLLIREHPRFTPKDQQARVNRTVTLDGGVVVDHLGISNGDLTFDIEATLTEDQEAVIWEMFSTQTYITVSTSIGFFLAVISKININRGAAKFTILVAE